MMDFSRVPLEIPFPSWVIETGVFDGREGVEGKYGRELYLQKEGFQITVTDLHSARLTLEHLAVWKTLYVQKCLCKASALDSSASFEITESDLMSVLGLGVIDHIGKVRAWQILRDLAHIRTSIERPKQGADKWGFKRSYSLLSWGGYRDADHHPYPWWYSVGVGPDACDTTAPLFDLVSVTNEDIERARRWRERPPVEWNNDNDETDAEEEIEKPTPHRKPRGPGFVYILTNPAMPGLIKIGKTRLDPTNRAAQLHTTGVPNAFHIEYACRTDDPDAVERAMHDAFGPKRVNDRREFFQIEPAQAIAVLALHHQDEQASAA